MHEEIISSLISSIIDLHIVVDAQMFYSCQVDLGIYFFWHDNHNNKSEEHDLVSLLMGLIGQIDRSGKVLTTILWSCYDDFK